MAERFILYSDDPLAMRASEIKRARAVLAGLGVTVVGAGIGGLLLEAPPAAVRKAASALPGWSWSAETTSHRIPEPMPRRRGAVAGSAKG